MGSSSLYRSVTKIRDDSLSRDSAIWAWLCSILSKDYIRTRLTYNIFSYLAYLHFCRHCFVFQACLVLQRRHLPDQPLEYLLKLRCEINSGVRYRERWIAADKLCSKFAAGAALIRQFEASKVGQLAVDTSISKLRSLPSPISSDKQDHNTGSAADIRHQKRSVHSVSKAVKRKSCDLGGQNTSCNCSKSASSESFKSNCVANNRSSPFCASKGTAHKLLSFYGTETHPISRHKHFAKRLLLSDKVPQRNWPKNLAKNLKLPNLVNCKPVEQKSFVSCKQEDSDSDADVRYSLATERRHASSDTKLNAKWGSSEKKRKLTFVNGIKSDSDADVRYSLATDHRHASSDTKLDAKWSSSEKKPRKLTFANGIKRSKSNTSMTESKQPKVGTNAKTKFKTLNLSATQPNCKAGIATESMVQAVYV